MYYQRTEDVTGTLGGLLGLAPILLQAFIYLTPRLLSLNTIQQDKLQCLHTTISVPTLAVTLIFHKFKASLRLLCVDVCAFFAQSNVYFFSFLFYIIKFNEILRGKGSHLGLSGGPISKG